MFFTTECIYTSALDYRSLSARMEWIYIGFLALGIRMVLFSSVPKRCLIVTIKRIQYISLGINLVLRLIREFDLDVLTVTCPCPFLEQKPHQSQLLLFLPTIPQLNH